jgi:alanine-glyoxylate transaminase/(R)-3-amino-2-methylpropionate-pyruvate transaminase
MHPKIYEYAERLSSKLPGDLNVVYFVNSGSEANDLAMLMARLYTKNHEILTLKNAYHGASTSTMGLTGICKMFSLCLTAERFFFGEKHFRHNF